MFAWHFRHSLEPQQKEIAQLANLLDDHKATISSLCFFQQLIEILPLDYPGLSCLPLGVTTQLRPTVVRTLG